MQLLWLTGFNLCRVWFLHSLPPPPVFAAKDFIVHLMEKDPNTRYTCDQALQHPWYWSHPPPPSQQQTHLRVSPPAHVNSLLSPTGLRATPRWIRTSTSLSARRSRRISQRASGRYVWFLLFFFHLGHSLMFQCVWFVPYGWFSLLWKQGDEVLALVWLSWVIPGQAFSIWSFGNLFFLLLLLFGFSGRRLKVHRWLTSASHGFWPPRSLFVFLS